MSARIILYLFVGIGLGAAVLLKGRLDRWPLSLPMLLVLIGYAAFSLPLGLPTLDPVHDATQLKVAEAATEFIVIVSLMAAGLAIDRPLTWRGWRQVVPLLAITMPLSIAAVALIGWWGLGLAPAAALLFAASASPTDPVLAMAVQVDEPGESERDDVRFDLTVEAGFNDALAFPFVHLAIGAVGMTALGGWTVDWLLEDVLWRVAVGVAVGVLVGRAGAKFVFGRVRDGGDEEAAETIYSNEGVVVMATLFGAYALAEICRGYGFLAVFVGAVMARQLQPSHEYHERTHQFVDQVEKVVMVGILLGIGGLLASGVLEPLTWPAAALSLGILFVVRPATGMLALARSSLPLKGRLAVAFFGVRGLGSIFYLAYGLNHETFVEPALLWAMTSFLVVSSIAVHGALASPVMRHLASSNAHVRTSP